MICIHMVASGVEAVNHGRMQAGSVAVTACLNTGVHFFRVCRVISLHGMVHFSFSGRMVARNNTQRLLAGERLNSISRR